MAKVLRIHKQANDNITDWGESKHYGKDVINQIVDPAGASAKMEITSIPSPFARVDLAKNAFKNVVDSADLDGSTIHHKIVSDCLDVAELFFNYDKLSDKLEIIVWDKEKEINALKSSRVEEHRILGHSLEMYLEQDAQTYNFDKLKRIYLLNYKGPGKPAQMNILGATSPSTLFISSANDLSYSSDYLKSNGKDRPFDDEFSPLYKRDFVFQEYIYALKAKLGDRLFAQRFPEFNDYLIHNYRLLTDEQKIVIDGLTEESINQYEELSLDGNTVEVLGLSLRKNTAIKDRTLYSDFIINSNKYKGTKPLVLPISQGNDYAMLKYVQDNWATDYHAPYQDDNELNQRILPHTSEKYPYLTISDFLQPYIISMKGYELTDYFFDGNINDKSKTFLLPLTDRFFDFFTVDDLIKPLPNGKKMIEILNLAGDCAKVILRIPIQKNHYIEYVRLYMSEPNAEENKGGVVEKKFGMGIMPLVKFDSTSTNPYYRVAFFSKENGSVLAFKQNNRLCEVKSHVIRRKAQPNCSVESYVIEDVFNRIIISIGNVKNVIIPKFKETSNASQFTFAVDFGTTNTHIEYSIDGSKVTHSMDIKREERQMQRMHKDYGADFDIKYAFEDAFVPDTIDDTDDYAFPVRTALAESKEINYNQPTNSLADGNLPFRFEKAVIPSYNKVITDIKWSNAERQRVTLYLDNIFFLLRNKVLLNNGNLPETKIIWFYPISMTNARYAEFKRIWAKLYDKYFNGNKEENLVPMSESIAPYYYYKSKKGLQSNAVTIDVGGGTTDVFVVEDNVPKILSSFRFAANSIFGDGYNFSIESNGFVNAYKSSIQSKLESNKGKKGISDTLNAFKSIENAENSSDIIAFFFSLASNKVIKNQNIPIDFLQMLADDEKFKYVFIIFYGSLLYYVAKMMKAKGLALPQTLAFSGNGSRTITVLSTEKKTIARFASLIFEKVFGKEYGMDKLEVILDEEPKLATCRGGIASRKENLSFEDIDPLKTSLLGVDDNQILGGIKYSDLSNSRLQAVADYVSDFVDFIFGLNAENRGFFTNYFNADQGILNKVRDICHRNLLEYTKQGLEKKREELEAWNLGDDSEVEETLFFYPLVPVLNRLASEI